jgi:hypothetical protein
LVAFVYIRRRWQRCDLLFLPLVVLDFLFDLANIIAIIRNTAFRRTILAVSLSTAKWTTEIYPIGIPGVGNEKYVAILAAS